MAEQDTEYIAVQEIPSSKHKIGLSGRFSALQHRNFKLFLSGQMISVAGTWMQVIAQSWLVYQITRSELALGLVAFASAVPALIITPWGGVVVDRIPGRTLLVITQSSMMVLAFLLALLTFSGAIREWHILVLAALGGLVNSFDAPGRQAFVVEMVGREDIPNAIALNSLVFNSGRVIGPALGGLTLAAFGSAWCFLINGFSFLAVIAGLLLMNVPPKVIHRQELSPWRQLKSGLQYTLAERELLALILLALIFSFFGLSYSAVLPAFVDQSLQSGAQGYGAVNAATGLGAVAAALFVASNSQLPRRGRWVAGANFFFCGVLFFFALNHSYPAALLLGLGLGVGFMLTFTFINTLLQTRVVDEMRGRVMSLYTLTFFGIAPFGNLAIGALSQAWGLNFILTLSALIAAVLALMVFLFIPRLLALD